MDIKNLIIDQQKTGKSLRFINKLLNLQHSTVQQVVNKYKKSGSVKNASRTDRPSELSSQEVRNILNEVNKSKINSGGISRKSR